MTTVLEPQSVFAGICTVVVPLAIRYFILAFKTGKQVGKAEATEAKNVIPKMTLAEALQYQTQINVLREQYEEARSNMRTNIDGMYQAISNQKDEQTERHERMLRDFSDLRVKVAAFTKLPNGGSV